jgi:membrane-associated protease RseP (regulator of RpoE activity)
MNEAPPPEKTLGQQPEPAARANAAEFDPRSLGRFMLVEGIRFNHVLGRIHEPVKENIARMQELMRSHGLVGFFRREGGGHSVAFAVEPARKPTRMWLHAVLLGATILTTMFVGALHVNANPLSNPFDILKGWPFSLGVILVLGSHELAHYLVARRLGVDATPPYFLPVPHPMTGTMGAFIRIRSAVPSRSALVRVGAAGPIVGFAVAVPVAVVGLALSRYQPVEPQGGIPLGSPLLFSLLAQLLHGSAPAGTDLMLHPVAFAGWLGMFVTALNLVPAGQLDGGHITYAILGRHYRAFTFVVLGLLLAGGLVWMGWPFWAMMTAAFGLQHPPPLDDVTPLSRADVLLALTALAVMVMSFTPVPFPVR